MHVLVVSPIASHPQFQGNSQRIFRLCRLLQILGCKVHFLYYPLEGLTQDQRRQMESCWDFFHSIPCRPLDRGMSLGTHYGLDDWYDPQIGDVAAVLHSRWNFKAVIVNYVWFSAVLESLPSDIVKIIDTHDVFGDRHLRSIALGMKPEWYFTDRMEELRGLQRADIVLAIQDEEKAYFQELGVDRVEVVGFVTPPKFLPRRGRSQKPVVGYIASGNPWNVNSFWALHEVLERRPELQAQYKFSLAGQICNAVQLENRIFHLKGIVGCVQDFYRNVDIVINPMLGGTGLKIKSIEALSYGRPFFSTADGMVGVPTPCKEHLASSIDDLISCLSVFSNSGIDRLAMLSRQVFLDYQSGHMENFREIIHNIGA